MTLTRSIALALAVLAATRVQALEGEDPWGVSFGGGLAHTENLLRLPAGVTPAQAGVGDRPRGTWIVNGYARGALDLRAGRQRLTASVQANSYRYADYSYLNWEGVDYGGAWLWEVGNRWTGTLSYEHTKFLSGLADFQAVIQNLRTVDVARAAAEYSIDPRWRLTGAFTGTFVDNSTAQLAANNLNEYAYGGGLKYVSARESYVTLGGRYARGDYRDRPFPTQFDNAYDQYDVGVDTFWVFGPKSEIGGHAGYTWREFPNLPQRDFSGPTGRLRFTWRPTEKTGLGVFVRREIGAIEDEVADYVVTTAGRVAPVWQITPKVQLEAALERQHRDYRADPQFFQREDRYTFANLGAVWRPTRNWEISLAVQYSTRNSNFPGNDYRDVSTYGTLRFGF